MEIPKMATTNETRFEMEDSWMETRDKRKELM